MVSAWSEHLKKYAADNNMTYKQAMSDEKSKTTYAKTKASLPKKEKPVKLSKPKKEKKSKSTPSPPEEPTPVEPLAEPLIKKKVIKRKKKSKVEPPLEE
jgi:hypothetical protein